MNQKRSFWKSSDRYDRKMYTDDNWNLVMARNI